MGAGGRGYAIIIENINRRRSADGAGEGVIMRLDNSTKWYHVILVTKESNRLQTGRPEYEQTSLLMSLSSVFLRPYRKGKPIVINGKTITEDDLDRIRIFKTGEKIEDRLEFGRWYKLPEVTQELITVPPAANQKLLLILPRNLDLHQPLRRFSSFMGETEKHGKHFFLSYGRSVSAPWNGQRLSSLRENRCLISEKSWMLPFRGHMLLLFF